MIENQETEGLIPLELVATNLREDARVPWIHYTDGAIVADFEHTLPDVSVPEVIQNRCGPRPASTPSHCPPRPASSCRSASTASSSHQAPPPSPSLWDCSCPSPRPPGFRAVSRTPPARSPPSANGTLFSFAFDAAPKAVHALGVAFEAAGVLRLKLERRGGAACV